MKKFMSLFKKQPTRPESTYGFMPIGFHGDRYLLDVVSVLLERVDVFIETGANVGSTLAYVARTFSGLPCYSCEPDVEAYRRAVQNTKDLSNVHLFNELSQDFISRIKARHSDFFTRQALFWLDAHGYGFEWPLREEVAFITSNFESAYILIDDFKVPGLDMFGYDHYNDQTCSLEYIQASLDTKREYHLYYPAYTEKTSTHHPLKGWGLINYGQNAPFQIPASLQGKMAAGKIT